MAFGDPGTLNSNFLAGAFAQVLTTQGIAISRRKNGLLYFMLGKPEPGSESADGAPKFPGLDDDFTGSSVEWTLETQPRLYTAVTDGTNEFAALAPSYDGNIVAGATAQVAHYPINENIPVSEMRKLKGPAAKVKNWMQQVFGYWLLNLEVTLGKAINGTTAGAAGTPTNQSQSAMGSWTWPVSDSNDTANWAAGVNTKNYGGLDRSVAANADFAGNSAVPISGTGAFALKDFTTATTRCAIHGAVNLFATMGESVWNIFKNAVIAAAGYMATTVKDNEVDYGGRWFSFDGCRMVLDNYCPTQTIGVFNPESWNLKLDRMNSFQMGDTGERNPGRVAIHTFQYDVFAALVCFNPGQNYKILGITS